MANYFIPTTLEERILALKLIQDNFAIEYITFLEKGKKASAYKARKALLNMSKLTKVIRLDIKNVLNSMKRKGD